MATRSFAPTCPVRPGWTRLAAILLVALALAFAVPAPVAGAAAKTARALYERAVALDQAVRAAMARPAAAHAATPQAFRDAIDAYRAVVWQHPTSGYCDNALWQASQLAVEVFDRFGLEQDRLAAITFLKTLVSQYPSSGFVRRARTTIQHIERLPSPTSRAAASPSPSRDRLRASPGPAPTPAPPPARAAEPVVSVDQVQRSATPEATTIVVHLGGPVTFREERLANPARVFFDIAGTKPADAVKDAILTFESGLVRQIRVGRHPNAVTRIVIDAEGVARHRAELLGHPSRLVITCWPLTLPATPVTAPLALVPAGPVMSAAPPPVPQEPAPVVVAPPAAPVPEADTHPATAVPAPVAAPVRIPAATSVPVPATADASAPPPSVPVAPSGNVRGGYSLARQLGLGASRIVIDAGHGGHDPGAMVGTKTESSITLDIALRLEKLLAKQPGVEVILTRRSDIFIPLPERTEIANREGADLFVSIHVNASENVRARGIETYLLDFASNADAERVAARENASTLMTMSSLNELVQRIALTTKADESRDLAVHLQNAMVRRLRPYNQVLRDLGVKRAPFVVLIGASMPSALVEVAFITHKQEGRLLATQTYRQRIAESLADGIRRYQQALKKASPVVLRRVSPSPASPGGQPGREQIP